MRREELLARIRKCLALSKSANEHEAAAALAKARQLMDEHGVDEVEAATLDVGTSDAKGGGAWTPSFWEASLVTTVTRAIPVKALSRGDSGWTFIGITPAPEIAAYAFATLYRQLKRARAEYMRTQLKRVATAQRKTKRADAFAEGWATAVFSKIAALYPKQDVDPLITAYLDRRYPERTTTRPRETALGGRAAENDRGRGWSEGRSAQLNAGVGTGRAPALIGSSA
jgi:hypothetical protein